MTNCNRCRNNSANGRSCGNGGCNGSFTEYIPVTFNYEVILGNGFVTGNGVSPISNGDCFYNPVSESSRYTPASGDCL